MGWLQGNLRWLRPQLKRRDRSEQDVEDLIQEAILRVAESCERHEVRDPASLFVRTVSRLSINASRDRERHAHARESVEELEHVLPLIDASPSAEELIASEERWHLIAEVLEGVDERSRRAFLLNRIHGQTYEQIARQLGISSSTGEKDVTWVMALLYDAAGKKWGAP
jgi:RNA polymerase sigma factor (sigma-70 family)